MPSNAIPAGAFSLCIAAAVRLRCGLVYPAVLFADTFDGIEINGVALLASGGRILYAQSDSPQERRQNLRRLGLSQSQVFPLEYATRAPMASSGSIATGVYAA